MTSQGSSLNQRVALLLFGDGLLAVASFVVAHLLRFGRLDYRSVEVDFYLATILLVLILLICSYIFDVYEHHRYRNRGKILQNIILSSGVVFLSLSVLFYLAPSLSIGRGLLALTLLPFALLQFLWHYAFFSLCLRLLPKEKVLILGTGSLAAEIGKLVQSPSSQFSLELAGYVAESKECEGAIVAREETHSPLEPLSKVVNEKGVTVIVVAGNGNNRRAFLHEELLSCKLRGIRVEAAQTFYEVQTGKLLLEYMDLGWLIYSVGFRKREIVNMIKRQVDILLAIVGMTLILPLLPILALLVKLNAAGPVFYKQRRVGQWEKLFVLYKFRTMPVTAEHETGVVWSTKNDPRIKPIGAFLRKFRLDELPQFFNVLRGDLSFIGPRPERPEYVAELEKTLPLYNKRHFIKPGLTGWAQICYPYGASVSDSYEKLRYDLYYFKNMSPLFDTMIFLKTIKVVLFGVGGR